MKKSYTQFIEELHNAHPNIVPTSEYNGYSNPIDFECTTCGYKWHTAHARSGIYHNCKKCSDKIRMVKVANAQKSRAKTEEQFRKELAEKQPNLIPNDKYINSGTKYHCICKIHNVDVYKTPDKYLRRNQGCNLCAIERCKTAIRYTDESYSELLEHYNPTLEKLSEFKGVKKRINLRCKICGYEWNPIAETTIGENHFGCPKCAGNAIKTPEEFREELKISHPYLILKSDYIRSNIPVKVHCTRCGSDYEIIPNKLQQGQQCLCYKESHSEFKTRIWLTEHNIKFEKEVTFDNLVGISEERQLSYDFYVPKYNTLIECQGEQHDHAIEWFGGEKQFKKQKEHDKRKQDYAKEHGYNFLEIWYYDLKNLDEILNDFFIKNAA